MSVCVITRRTKKGVTYHVRWSQGRLLPYILLGTFRYDSTPRDGESNPALRRAETMRELALDDLARSIDPRERILKLNRRAAADRKLFPAWAEEYLASRRDLINKDGTENGALRQKRGHIEQHLVPVLGRDQPKDIGEEKYAAFVRELAKTHAPSTIHAICKKTLRDVLRYAGVSEADNPTNSKRVKLPKIERKRVRFAAGWVYAEMRERLSTDEQREAWDVLIHGGLRVGEVEHLQCHQLDNAHDRLVAVESKDNPPRVVQRLPFEPDWIPKRPGLKPTDRVFPGLRKNTMADVMRRCSKEIGWEHMPDPEAELPLTPQDLRELCASRLVNAMAQTGLTWSDILERDGHSLPVLQKHYQGTNPPPHSGNPIAPAA